MSATGSDGWYSKPDPWAYQTTLDDWVRLGEIIKAIQIRGKWFERALDVGAGEGWVTQFLPATQRFGYEIDDKAASRFPPNVARCKATSCTYDLVICTGVLYRQYRHEELAALIRGVASDTVLIAGLKHDLIDHGFGELLYSIEFPYRGMTQVVRLYAVAS